MAQSILVVDDDSMFSDMLSEILTAEGYTVLVEHDGASGLKNALANHPDLLVMDFMMPHMSGADAVRELRKDEWGKTLPVLLLTNMAQADLSLDTSGKIECLLKTDWTLEALLKKIKDFLAQPAQS